MHVPSVPKIKMIFAASLNIDLSQVPERPLLIVSKTAKPPSFNSFGFRFQVDCHLFSATRDIVEISTEMMFEGSSETYSALDKLLAEGSGWIDASQVSTTYCSLLYREENYRDLVERTGLETAAAVLRSVGDAVILGIERNHQARLDLIESKGFALSMLRQNESWTAYRRGSRHLRYNPIPKVSDAATSFGMVVDLPSAKNRYRIDFDFGADRLIRDRFAVLIGKNGSGKTQILLSIIDGLTNHPEIKLVPRRQRVRFVRNEAFTRRLSAPPFSRLIVFSSTPSDLYPAKIAPWWGIDYQYFSLLGQPVGSGDPLTMSIVDCWRDDGRTPLAEHAGLSETSRLPGRLLLLRHILQPLGLWDGLVMPLKHSEESAQHASFEWNGRSYVKARIMPSEEKRLLMFKQIDLSEAPIFVDPASSQPRHLSSGETAMFRFAAQATASVETGTLFLFDEPETHLHAHYISEFAEILHLLLEATKSVAIAATHSAYLVREAPSRRVRVLRIEDRVINIDEPRLQTFGAGIDAISNAVFGDAEVRHQYQNTIRKWVKSLGDEITIGEVLENYGADMNPETLAYVRRLLGPKAANEDR